MARHHPHYDRDYDDYRRGTGRGSARGALTAGLFALAAGAAAFAVANRATRRVAPSRPEDAPWTSWRRSRLLGQEGKAVVSRTVTINRSRNELYAFWRDFAHLPDFMENVVAVEILDNKRSRWTIAAPGGQDLTFETRITEERQGELIAWESVEDAPVRHHGRIAFRDAPAGRGTEVEATIVYDPPGGRAGELIAKLFQREPNIQARRELKRFKQLMETGEIATAQAGPAAPRA